MARPALKRSCRRSKAKKLALAGTDSRDYVAEKKAVKKTLSWAEISSEIKR